MPSKLRPIEDVIANPQPPPREPDSDAKRQSIEPKSSHRPPPKEEKR